MFILKEVKGFSRWYRGLYGVLSVHYSPMQCFYFFILKCNVRDVPL